eukprot:gene25702-biopygen4522
MFARLLTCCTREPGEGGAVGERCGAGQELVHSWLHPWSTLGTRGDTQSGTAVPNSLQKKSGRAGHACFAPAPLVAPLIRAGSEPPPPRPLPSADVEFPGVLTQLLSGVIIIPKRTGTGELYLPPLCKNVLFAWRSRNPGSAELPRTISPQRSKFPADMRHRPPPGKMIPEQPKAGTDSTKSVGTRNVTPTRCPFKGRVFFLRQPNQLFCIDHWVSPCLGHPPETAEVYGGRNSSGDARCTANPGWAEQRP